MAAKKSSRKKTAKVSKRAAAKPSAKPAKPAKAKSRAKSARSKKGGARDTGSPTSAPRPGAKEEHYADLRRVALANALARLR